MKPCIKILHCHESRQNHNIMGQFLLCMESSNKTRFKLKELELPSKINNSKVFFEKSYAKNSVLA